VRIRASQLHTGTETLTDALLEFENERITRIAKYAGESCDSSVESLVPGFVDVHCHGGGGAFFFDEDDKAIDHAAQFHLNHGTTTLVASFIANPVELIERQITRLVALMPLKNIRGMHLEGPFLSEIFCGAHNPEFLLPPTDELITRFLKVGKGNILMMTIAPELPNAMNAIRNLASQGVIAAIGHSDADNLITRQAIDNGAKLVTHFFSAMRPIHHRIGSMTLATLLDERIHLELILDSVHIFPEAVAIPKSLAPRRVIAITDALSVAGQPDGDYRLGTVDVELRSGIAKIKGKDLLAGSTLTMDRSFKSAITKLNFTPLEAVQAFATRPAKLFGFDDVGELRPGHRADFLAFDSDWNLKSVWFRGSQLPQV